MHPGTAAIGGIDPRIATISFCAVAASQKPFTSAATFHVGVVGEDLLLAGVERLVGLRADDAAVEDDVAGAPDRVERGLERVGAPLPVVVAHDDAAAGVHVGVDDHDRDAGGARLLDDGHESGRRGGDHHEHVGVLQHEAADLGRLLGRAVLARGVDDAVVGDDAALLELRGLRLELVDEGQAPAVDEPVREGHLQALGFTAGGVGRAAGAAGEDESGDRCRGRCGEQTAGGRERHRCASWCRIVARCRCHEGVRAAKLVTTNLS
nr:hypothetical protein [Microbacterium sp. Yaish 1]